MVGFTLACKFNDDLKLDNADFAKLGGITTAELGILELEFLHTLEFSLKVNHETFTGYFQLLFGHLYPI